MKCKKCGYEFSGGIFCPKCGTKNVEECKTNYDDTIQPTEKNVETSDNEKKPSKYFIFREWSCMICGFGVGIYVAMMTRSLMGIIGAILIMAGGVLLGPWVFGKQKGFIKRFVITFVGITMVCVGGLISGFIEDDSSPSGAAQDTKENSVVEIEERTDEKQEVEEAESIESAEIDYGAIYGKILDGAVYQYSEYNYYFFYDINKDGVKELIVCEGESEADYVFHGYTIMNNTIYDIGCISGGHSMLYIDEENCEAADFVLKVRANMGYETQYLVRIQEGQLIEEEISSAEVMEYYEGEPVPYAELSDRSLLIEE